MKQQQIIVLIHCHLLLPLIKINLNIFFQVKEKFCVDAKAFEGCVIPEHELQVRLHCKDPPQVNDIVNYFQIREPLGKGEFGEVLLGMWNDKRVAVKMLKDSSEAAQKFLAEAKLMK